MPKIESEKIACLHRPCSRPAPWGKIESVRTHPEVIEQFDSFSLLKLLFLVRNWHCWSRKAFPRQMTPQSREKTAETAVFRHRWQAWKVVRSIAAVRKRPRTPRNWLCSFAFFESFLWHFNKKQRTEVIFRLSRPVSCKNQENGSGKQWSLHAPLNHSRFKFTHDLFKSIAEPSWLFTPCSSLFSSHRKKPCIKVYYVQVFNFLVRLLFEDSLYEMFWVCKSLKAVWHNVTCIVKAILNWLCECQKNCFKMQANILACNMR